MNTSEPIIHWQLPNIDNVLIKGFIKDNSALDQEIISGIESALISFGIRGGIVEVLHGVHEQNRNLKYQ